MRLGKLNGLSEKGVAMRTEWYAGTVTALTSISHIGPGAGGQTTKSYLRREKFIQLDGRAEMVPVVSGNGMRGLLRDRGMWHMCRELGYGDDGQGLSLPAFHFLFSGGSLTKVSSRGLDVDSARKIRELIPLVGLFGGAVGNQIINGKLKIGKMIPVCEETKHLLPDWCVGGSVPSVYEYIQEESFTRKDDEKHEKLRELISPGVRQLIEAKAGEKRLLRGTVDEKPDSEVGKHQQMLYEIESLGAGTCFFWEVALEDVTDVEYDAFWTTMGQFARLPYIGGKSGTGHGKVAVNFRDWLRIDPRLAGTEKMLDVPVGARYQQHLSEKADEIRGLLASWE